MVAVGQYITSIYVFGAVLYVLKRSTAGREAHDANKVMIAFDE